MIRDLLTIERYCLQLENRLKEKDKYILELETKIQFMSKKIARLLAEKEEKKG